MLPTLIAASSDYIAVDTTVTFPSGAQSGVVSSGSRQCIAITIIVDDASPEPDEVFQVMAMSLDTNAHPPPAAVSVSIVDNEP